jgi:hydroxypyruvate reductase
VHKFVNRIGDQLLINQKTYELNKFDHIFLIATGKASVPMARAVHELIGNEITAGIVITKEVNKKESIDRLEQLNRKYTIYEANHPIPDERSVTGSSQIIKLLENVSKTDLVIILLSGGSSALSAAPVDGVSLSDLQALTDLLLGCGATINEINTIRKHLDKLKGGRLAELANPAAQVTLILSDVVGDPVDIIASGPTVPDPSTYQQAIALLERYQLTGKISVQILSYLNAGVMGLTPETPKPGNPIFLNSDYIIIASNYLAVQAAIELAQKFGYNTLLLTTYLQGEASQVGKILASIVRQILSNGTPIPRPALVVAAGETTVTLNTDPSITIGLGGRNQELALSSAIELSGSSNYVIISLATDGIDGPTDAGGAVVTDKTLHRAKLIGLDPIQILIHHDAYHFFAPLGDLLKPGPTRTNVNDLIFLFCI